MSRSNHARKPKDRSKRPSWRDGGWIFESNREQRRRMKREVDKVLKDTDFELQLSNRRESSFDWP